jgi:hypothetical protein
MRKEILLLLTLLLTEITFHAHAQRGLPPDSKTRSPMVTKYAQHLDFIPLMVKMLNVPDGWDVSIAAFGLGGPRMLYPDANGKLDVTEVTRFINEQLGTTGTQRSSLTCS